MLERCPCWKHGVAIPETMPRRRLARWLKLAQAIPELRRRAPGVWSVELAWIARRAPMARLNGRYRGKPRPTDVLSFPAPEVFRRAGILGEIAICGPVLREQAREEGHGPALELDVLLVHGLLHLLGFDHERSPRAAREMARWERRLLATRASRLDGEGGLIRRGDSVRS